MEKVDGYKNYIFGALLFLNGIVGTVFDKLPLDMGMSAEQMIGAGIAWILGRDALNKVGSKR